MTSLPTTFRVRDYYDVSPPDTPPRSPPAPQTAHHLICKKYYAQQSNFFQPTLSWFVGITFPHQGLNQGCVSKSAKS